ncbi:MAG: hypothetical protein IJT19_04950 [Bacteroidaceae bacterium]|nr:hypothetical protein [Bacteroidaceae bacterium]
MFNVRQAIGYALGAAMLCLVVSCSTKKNTPATRFYHATTARFNTVYNGQIAYIEGVEAQERGHQDDYTQLLPMLISTNKSTASMGKSNYDEAILKCEKAIKLHSIKKRPTMSNGKKLTPKAKEFRARREFNPYLRHAWMMLGKAQFQKGEFIEAASTFNYIIRLYSTQPEVSSVARAWLARCYVALEWPYDAEDVLDKMRRDSITPEGQRELTTTRAAYLIATEQYEQAIPELRKTIKNTKHKLQRSRLNFLMGQMQHELGLNDDAYKSFARVVRSNPPYELAFNARILQTEVMSGNSSKAMIKKLQRMAKSDKNKDYLDQVYYAIGNIYLASGDTLKCIGAYEKGAEESTKSGAAKAMVLLRLSQIYWETEKYVDAQRTYAQCIAILNKEHEEYAESEWRSKALDEAAPHLDAVKLQDSLQELAKMPEGERLAAIDRVIEALKKKEKEEAKKAAQNGTANTANTGAQSQQTQNRANNNTPQAATTSQNRGAWYFYNPQTVTAGKQAFQRQWGNRKNEDNWRRSNKTVATGGEFEEYNYDENTDSIAAAEQSAADEEEQRIRDSLANDPHHREFYLAQIPFTEEQMAASNQLLEEGLYKGGIAVMERIQNYPYALRMLLRLLEDFPETQSKADVYYHLFLLYWRMDDNDRAQQYRTLLVDSFPEDKNAIRVANPNYERIAREGKHLEDSLYAATYDAYLANQYDEVDSNYTYHTDNFPLGQHRARIMFIRAMTYLYTGQRTEFLDLLKELVQSYSKEEIGEMAAYIVKGLQEGRLLSDDKYNASDIWKRRRSDWIDGDSTQVADTLSTERYTTYNFVLAYPTNSLDEDQLLYEMARYNFTSYMVRNFEIEVLDDNGLSMMCIRGFLSYDEVHAYAQALYSDRHMATLLEGIRTLLISDENLENIGKAFSFDEYKEFFDQQFAPLEIPEDLRIDEPTDLEVIDPDDYVPEAEAEEEDATDDDFPFNF